MNERIEQRLKTLPDGSGVYIMKNFEGEIIYVGKAKILKNRVRSYFRNHNHPPKVAAMVSNVDDFEYIMTDSEMEAFVLENNLIKEHSPKYNILLKDDKTYPFLKITTNEEYPRIFVTRQVRKDGAKYFGPYLSAIVLRDLIELIKEIFRIRSCNKNFPADIGKVRPCLYYHIGKCMGICNGNVSSEEYNRTVGDIISFLNGKYDKVQRELTNEMNEAATAMDFERAAQLRDRLRAIESLADKQKIVSADGADTDAVAFYSKHGKTCFQIFFVRGGKVIGRENYFTDDTDGIDEGELLADFIRQYYGESSFVPKEILLERECTDMELIRQWLSELCGRKVDVHVPKIGDNAKLIRMIKANAEKELSERELKILRDIKFKNNAMAGLYKLLKLDTIPKRIEAYDISNISGDNNVGSMVTFIDARPSTKDYKNFKIKNVTGSDDYACMAEVITRRFERAATEQERIDSGELPPDKASFSCLPDILFVDGGQGHVNTVAPIVEKFAPHIPVFGIVKDDKHRTRGVVSVNGEIEVDKTSEVFMLLTNIQDEMHRRAITYNSKLNTKKNLKSELDNIGGVGDVRKRALLRHFKSVKNIASATAEELASVKGIDRTTAENIALYFSDRRKTDDTTGK
ncbi:MAG: excinuclease ABC subunit UvrC [Clostridia bacterium]|nr:excinuclease ABC subunit UvrC [Clostridia bacterium]